jgi:hypothetical protein
LANEIKFYLSGGASNANPFLSLGGSISNTEIVNGLLNNLWSDVSETDCLNGLIDHRVIFIKNVSGATLTGTKAYFGELDTFTGMAILSTTGTNSSVTLLSAATDLVLDYFQVWTNIAETPASTINLNQTNRRVVLNIANAKHPVYNQYPDKIDILMAKTGAPTGTATIKIWAMASGIVPTATDNTVIRTLGTIDVSTLTTTMTKYTFSTPVDLVTNPLPSVGWRIGIEYLTGTATAHVDIAQTSQPAGTALANYHGGFSQTWDGTKWVDFATNSPCFNIYTNHGACFQGGTLPPPGGGTPPPGECLASNAAPGTVPVAGGGGGAAQHGYAITSAVDNGNDGNIGTNAIDRKTSTRWSQNSTNALLTIDMGVNHPIDRVKIAWYKSSERQAKFNLSYSTDNSTYTPITPIPAGPNYISNGTNAENQYEEFTVATPSPQNAITARYVRYTGLGNTVNTWNSVTELEVYGPDVSNIPPGSPPPPDGINYSKPSSFDTGIPVPDLGNGDFIAIHLERAIPISTAHVETDNYSIVISNEPHPTPPSDEPIPPGGSIPPAGGGTPGGGGGIPPIGEIPLPTPPGVFDPGTIPPPQPIPDPPPPGTGQCPGDPNQPPDPGGTPTPGGGGTGTTPDGIKLVELPAGYNYGQQYTGFHENFQSNGSFRLDVGVQPQLNELNLTFALNLSSGSDEISSKLSGGTHTDSKAKNGRCYDIGLNQGGDRVRIRKEDPHPSYHDGPSHSISLGSLNGKWVYVQSLKWNEGSNVHLQCWVDTSGASAPTNKFVKILDDIDTGGWFESPYLTVYDSSDSQTTIRVDSMSTSKFHYQMLCATRIVHA